MNIINLEDMKVSMVYHSQEFIMHPFSSKRIMDIISKKLFIY